MTFRTIWIFVYSYSYHNLDRYKVLHAANMPMFTDMHTHWTRILAFHFNQPQLYPWLFGQFEYSSHVTHHATASNSSFPPTSVINRRTQMDRIKDAWLWATAPCQLIAWLVKHPAFRKTGTIFREPAPRTEPSRSILRGPRRSDTWLVRHQVTGIIFQLLLPLMCALKQDTYH